MANRDGTGPNGEGPRTGRGLGNCDRLENLQTDEFIRGRGFGRGLGRGLGRRRCWRGGRR